MEVFRDIGAYDGRPSAVCVGVFDGMHLGHRALLGRLVDEARARGLVSLAVTFEPHPRIVLSKGNDRVGLLSGPGERASLFEAAGVDRLAVIPFTREFSDVSAREFLAGWLRDRLCARFLLLGYNHRFGGDDVPPECYVGLAASVGLEAVRAGVFSLPDGGKVSSTVAREALAEGDVAAAARVLGRDYELRGVVVHGDALGRTFGVRTANVLPYDECRLVPADGVYACWVAFGGEPHRAVVNVGSRPTVGGGERRIEAHVMDFDADVYGREVTVAFHARLRGEVRFGSTAALAGQIASDMAAARAAL